MALEFEQPGGSFGGRAHQINYDHDAREWDWWARYTDVGRDFRADMGFMPRGDYTFLRRRPAAHVVGRGGRLVHRDPGGRRLGPDRGSVGPDAGRGGRGQPQHQRPQAVALLVGLGTRDQFFDGVTFDDQSFYNTWFEVRPSGAFWFAMFTGYGDAIDFANTRPGTRFLWEPSIRLNLGLRLRLDLDHDLQRFEVDEGTLFEANLTQLRLVYQINVRTFVRTIFQYRSIERNPELYVDEVDAMTERLFTQFLFSYKLNPQTVLFLGYADNREGDRGHRPHREQPDAVLQVRLRLRSLA